MGTAKRERQKANRQLRLESMAKEAQRKKSRKRLLLFGIGIPVLVLAVFGIFYLTGNDDSSSSTVDTATDDTLDLAVSTTVAGETTVPGVTTTTPVTVPGAAITGETPCPAADGSSERTITFEQAPPTCIDDTKTYTATIETNFGTLEAELDPTAAPNTVNNFVTLARYHYFDQTECHRAIPGFVVQCGDPTATGGGGPGYEFADELPEDGQYQVGSLAMANSGPDTNGSQFFIITGEQGASLSPDYSLFGQVTVGLDDILPLLDAAGNPDQAANGVPPLQQIIIKSVTITES